MIIHKFQKYLNGKGIQYSFVGTNQTLLQFSCYEINYLFEYDSEADPSFVRILVPRVKQIEADKENLQELHILTRNYKVGKAFLVNGQVWFSADAFVYGNADCESLFERLLLVLRDMFEEYKEKNHG